MPSLLQYESHRPAYLEFMMEKIKFHLIHSNGKFIVSYIFCASLESGISLAILVESSKQTHMDFPIHHSDSSTDTLLGVNNPESGKWHENVSELIGHSMK